MIHPISGLPRRSAWRIMTEARRCLEKLDSRSREPFVLERQEMLSLHLREHGLLDWWPRHQRQVEASIGSSVSTFIWEMLEFDDGTPRLALDYFTDAASYGEVERLDAAMWEALKPVHDEHPDGPGMLLGAVVLTVHGPRIPMTS